MCLLRPSLFQRITYNLLRIFTDFFVSALNNPDQGPARQKFPSREFGTVRAVFRSFEDHRGPT